MVPPDDEHPYGHGKIESLAGFGESILLLCIVGYLAFESIHRLIAPEPITQISFGIVVMGASAAVSLAVGLYVRGVAEKSGSMSLRSNGQHLLTDFWTSVGVMLALLITHFTHWQQADSFVGLTLSVWLGWSAYKMAHEAFHELIDRRISDDEYLVIQNILRDDPDVISYHRLRTRHSGSWHYVDVHIVVPRDWSVVQGHDLADRLEKSIASTLSPCHVVIHIDPFDPRR